MKKFLAMLLAVVMVFALCACGKTAAPAAEAPATEGGKQFEGVTLEYASCFNEAEQQAIWIKEIAEQWQAETGAKINFNWAGRDVLTAIKADMLIGNAPDIIDQDASEEIAAFASTDEIMLEPLNDVYEMTAPGESAPIKDNMNGSYTLYTIDGKDYVVPFIYITSGFFYNKTLFKELGISAPKTWDEFIKVCDAIEASGIPALSEDGNISFYNCYYFQAACARILGSGKFLEAALDETGESWRDPGFLQAAQLISELSAAGKDYFQDGYAGCAYPAGQSDWAMGGSGMVYCGTWIPLETQDLTDDDFEFGYFPFPEIPDGKGSTTDIEAQLMSFCVPKDAKNKDAAKDLIRYLSSKTSADRCVELSDNMSARTDAIYPEALVDVKPTVDASTAYHKNYDGAMSAAPEWWANVFYAADDALLFGEITPEEFIEQMATNTAAFYANKG